MTDADPAAARLAVNLAALGRNLDRLAARVPGAEVAPVLKADAYGVGATTCTPVASYLIREKGVRTIFVATFAEATSLISLLDTTGPAPAVYALNGYAGQARRRDDREAIPVLSSEGQAAAWQDNGGGRCAIALDIGMHRLGLDLEGALALPDRARLDPASVDLVSMHLSHAGDRAAPENLLQAARFTDWATALRDVYPGARFSLSNSGGILLDLPAEQQVIRPGYALYGGAPSGDPADALETVATFTAPVIMTRTVGTGTAVGYDGRWTAQRPSRLAILGVGYADGYHRCLTNKGVVFLGGAECPVAGAVSMDLLTVDITDAPEPVAEGDRAELFGDRIKLDRLAGLAGTIGYELLTAIGHRVERRYGTG